MLPTQSPSAPRRKIEISPCPCYAPLPPNKHRRVQCTLPPFGVPTVCYCCHPNMPGVRARSFSAGYCNREKNHGSTVDIPYLKLNRRWRCIETQVHFTCVRTTEKKCFQGSQHCPCGAAWYLRCWYLSLPWVIESGLCPCRLFLTPTSQCTIGSGFPQKSEGVCAYKAACCTAHKASSYTWLKSVPAWL